MGQAVKQVKQDTSPQASYKRMMVSDGGVMLLVRLHADLQTQPQDVLRQLANFDQVPQSKVPAGRLLPANPRLRVTYDWLERKFGRSSAARAVSETAKLILGI
ncbi:MAG: hypothetical protein ABR507_03520 [Actinomycetota bacterium]